jgi:MoxR-like ATPase
MSLRNPALRERAQSVSLTKDPRTLRTPRDVRVFVTAEDLLVIADELGLAKVPSESEFASYVNELVRASLSSLRAGGGM